MCYTKCGYVFENRPGSENGTVTWATYERMRRCSDTTVPPGASRCHAGASKYLKFVNVTNPTSNHANSIKSDPFCFAIVLMLSALMFKLMIEKQSF